jgi:hypothetical protein
MGWLTAGGWREGKQLLNPGCMSRKRRALVLVDESARHPFLRGLPPHVRGKTAGAALRRPSRQIDAGDWRAFLATFCAAFVAVSIWIA